MTLPPAALLRLCLCAALAGAAGCATVAPWDKDELAKPCMEFAADGAAQAFRTHALITNEQAMGGEGGSGGGCGCR
jgi:hypothetical protein